MIFFESTTCSPVTVCPGGNSIGTSVMSWPLRNTDLSVQPCGVLRADQPRIRQVGELEGPVVEHATVAAGAAAHLLHVGHAGTRRDLHLLRPEVERLAGVADDDAGGFRAGCGDQHQSVDVFSADR